MTEHIYSVQNIAEAVGESPTQINAWRKSWEGFPPPNYCEINGKMWLWDVQRATKAIRMIRSYQNLKGRNVLDKTEPVVPTVSTHQERKRALAAQHEAYIDNWHTNNP